MNANAIPRRTFQLRPLIFFILITLGVGLFGGLLGGMVGYDVLTKPPLTPSASTFSAVWTVLYIMTGIAAYMVYNANDIDSGRVLRLYLLQLLFNALWPLLFFRFGWRLFSFFWMLILILLVSLVLAGFKDIRKSAYWLMIPYFLWLLFITYVNLGFYLLNRVTG